MVSGSCADSLLDTYQAERHPIAARVLKLTLAQVALMRGDERTKVLHENVSELLAMDGPRRRYGAMMSGLDIHYDLGSGHPLLGRRMPDLDLTTASGPRRVFTLLHDARPVLLDFGAQLDIAAWADRVRQLDAVRGRVGASGARRGCGSLRRVDSTRRARRLGWRRYGPGPSRRADYVVRPPVRAEFGPGDGSAGWPLLGRRAAQRGFQMPVAAVSRSTAPVAESVLLLVALDDVEFDAALLPLAALAEADSRRRRTPAGRAAATRVASVHSNTS